MHKKKFIIATILAITIMCSCGVTKNRKVEAMPDVNLNIAATLFIDGSDIQIPGYSINQSNYYHLRSLAMAVMNTTGRFKVSDVGTDYIKLETGYNYTDPVETFYAPTITADDVRENARAIYINDTLVDVSAYVVDGDTYINLRDLSEEMGYKINYVPENNKVWVSTSDSICSYIRDVVYNPMFTYYPFTNIGLNIEDINKMLSHSYISSYGQYFYDLQNKYGLNVVYAIAVAYVESGRGKYPCAKNNYFGMLGCNYSSPAAGIDAFGALMMKKLYYGKTIDQIAPIYCDNQWAGLVKKMMSEIWSYRV